MSRNFNVGQVVKYGFFRPMVIIFNHKQPKYFYRRIIIVTTNEIIYIIVLLNFAHMSKQQIASLAARISKHSYIM